VSGRLERLWYAARPEPLVRRLLLGPLWLLSLGFRGAVALRGGLYRAGLLRTHRTARARVVSVGNLTVGGAGKTPAVIHLARWLTARGVRVAVLSRGYGRTERADRVLLPGAELPPAHEVGDEPRLIARACPGVPVLVGRDRAALASRAEAELGAQVLLLDDGFQHRRLARDVDVVVVDAAVGLGNGHLLPRGPLREPPAALGRATLLWLREAEAPRPLALPGGVPVLRAAYRPGALATLGGEGLEAAALRGRRVVAFAGIARPERFADSLRALGAEVVALEGFADHHAFLPAELEALRARAVALGAQLVTTEKDAARLPASFPCWVLGLTVEVREGEAHLARLLGPGARGPGAL
jgi:tetraacyldisaccharide 4'-kinase